MNSPSPIVSRPGMPKSYGVPQHHDGLLDWSHVAGRMQAARNYWIATVTPDGKPHTVPVWGVWVSDALFFGGGADTRWARNLAANPHVSVHLESASDVVIFEGMVEQINDPAHPLAAPVEAAYVAKYNMPHGLPVWRLLPRKALAWTRFFDDATRWTW